MDNVRSAAYRTTAESIIKKLALRNMIGHYCETASDAVELVRALVANGEECHLGRQRHVLPKRCERRPHSRRPPHDRPYGGHTPGGAG